jgi:DNA-binding transcriptional regulator YdaS (Cro superfamily)
MVTSVNIEVVKEKGGGYSRLAKSLGLQRATVWGWKAVPAKHAIAVERITGIPREELRPDLYPRDAEEDLGSEVTA